MHSKVLIILWAVVAVACFVDRVQSSCPPPSENDHWLDRHGEHSEDFKDFKGVNTKILPLPRQNYTDIVEANINRQINLELFAHYTYLSMAYHFDRDDINLPGFHKFFAKMAEEEHEHAQKQPLSDGIWGDGTTTMSAALELEKCVNSELLNLHKLGQENNDAQFLDFLESNFLGEQVESIKQLSDYVNTLRRLNSSLGEYQFDQLTLQKTN